MNSLILCAFISSVAFTTHDQRSTGIIYHSPANDIKVRMSMLGFVDDSTCITGGSPQDIYQQMKQMMTADAQLWHNILWVTGGKLELSKCR